MNSQFSSHIRREAGVANSFVKRQLPAPKPEVKTLVGEAVPSSNLLQRDHLTFVPDKDSIALVPVLVLGGNPPAVFCGVAATAIDPIDSHAFRFLAHVSEEVREVTPALAHSNPLGSVVRNLRVFAPLQHGSPSYVGDGFWLGPSCMTMPAISAVNIAAQATTAFSVPVKQGLRSGAPGSSAVTDVGPSGLNGSGDLWRTALD